MGILISCLQNMSILEEYYFKYAIAAENATPMQRPWRALQFTNPFTDISN